jgi:hypothetical protein
MGSPFPSGEGSQGQFHTHANYASLKHALNQGERTDGVQKNTLSRIYVAVPPNDRAKFFDSIGDGHVKTRLAPQLTGTTRDDTGGSNVGKVATLSNTVASVARVGTRQGLVAADTADTRSFATQDALDGMTTAQATQAVARATQAGVKSAAANTAKSAELASKALAEANARIDAKVAQMGLPAATAKAYANGLKNAAAAQVAQAVRGE